MSSPRGRYAPSPTGHLHLGNLRTALIAWLCARGAGAAFVLRIEDLDSDRCRPQYEASQLSDLRALGIDWDGPIVRQSGRLDHYEQVFATLQGAGLVYRCFCSRRDIREAASAEHGPGEEIRYPGTCERISEAEAARRAATGEEHAWRLRARSASVSFDDLAHGTQTGLVDDFVLRRRDGTFAYNLAVVVDDAVQGVTEIVRGDDLLSTTNRQAFLYDMVGLARPAWRHVPLVLDPATGERMAKREGARTLDGWRAAGGSVATLLAAFAESLGLAADGHPDDAAALLGGFDPAAIRPQPVAVTLPGLE